MEGGRGDGGAGGERFARPGGGGQGGLVGERERGKAGGQSRTGVKPGGKVKEGQHTFGPSTSTRLRSDELEGILGSGGINSLDERAVRAGGEETPACLVGWKKGRRGLFRLNVKLQRSLPLPL